MKIDEILKQPEGRKIEFKEELPSSSDINKTAVSFANDAGGKMSADEYGQLWQPEYDKIQPEFKVLLNQGIKQEQQELQQEFINRQPELRPESLYTAIVLRLAKNNLSKSGLANALGHNSISGQLKVVINKLMDDGLIEWTIPDKPNSSKQKYKLTKRGVAFWALPRTDGDK